MDALGIGQELNVKEKMQVAGGVIVRVDLDGNESVLIIKRAPDDHWPNHWEFPRGKCDHGKSEDIIHCLKREIKEEVGLDIEPKFMIDSFRYLAGGTRLTTQINYYCYMTDPEQKVKLSKEHSEFKWIRTVGEAELLVFADMKRTIGKVLHKDQQIVNYNTGSSSSRSYDGGSNMSHIEEITQKAFKEINKEDTVQEIDHMIDTILETKAGKKKPKEADSGENENEIETGDKPDTPMKTMDDLKDEVSESSEFDDDFNGLTDRIETLKGFM